MGKSMELAPAASPNSERTAGVRTVRDWLRIFFRRKTALLIPLGAAVILGGPLTLAFPPKYSAEALVKRQDLAILNSAPAGLISRSEPSGVTPNTLRVEILTWDRLARVIRQLGLDADLKTAADWQNEYDQLRKSITIESVSTQSRGIDLVKIGATSKSPLIAQRVANAIADNYVEESKIAVDKPTEDARKFLAERAEETLAKLKQVEQDLAKFNRERFEELPDVKKAILQQTLDLHTQLTARTLQVSAARSRLAEIEKQMKDVPPRISVPIGDKEEVNVVVTPSDKVPETEDSQKAAQIKQQLEILLANFTEDHPDVKRLREELAALQHKEPPVKPGEAPRGERMVTNPAFQQLILDALSVRQEIEGCDAALREIQSEIVAREGELRQVVGEEMDYNGLVRQQRELENTYSQYHESQLAAETREQLTNGKYGTQVEMIQRAIEPAVPYRLGRIQVPAACLLVGAALGLALVFLFEHIDPSFQSAHDAASFLGIPILGKISVIPEPEAARRRKRILWTTVIAVAVLLGLASVALACMETVWPETFERLMALVRQFGK